MQKCSKVMYVSMSNFYPVCQLMYGCKYNVITHFTHRLYLFCLVVNLLKKYYHNLWANMIPEDARNININKIKWLTFDEASLFSMTNKQFLDILIIKTENNHQLLRFCSTYDLFMNRSSNKNIIKNFKSG